MDPRVAALLEEVGLPAGEAAGVALAGHDPVLASPFRVGEVAATALAACASAAALLLSRRTGLGQTVSVDVGRAAASLLGYRFQRLEEPTGDDPTRVATGGAAGAMTGLVALHRCADGRWIHLHGAFPRLAERTLEVLGCPPVRDQVAEAVSRWDALALEDALAAAGTCGAMVRTADEWRATEQGRAVAALGRIDIVKVAESDPEPAGEGARPLGGVRVVDLTRVLAGPTHGRVLAEHGADVLLVNSPSLPNSPPFVMDTSHGKLSAWLDLDQPDDAARLRELASTCDVFAQGYRTGALSRRGLGVEELAALRPGIVYVSINCYGDDGPWRERPGWEQLAQSATGLAAEQGRPGRPTLIPAAACDYTTGYLAALGTMAALWRRAAEGGSYHVRASLCQTGTWIESTTPRCDPDAASGLADADDWLVSTDTPYGRLRHLPPVAAMSETPPRWDRPTAPLGTHAAAWPT